MECCLCFQVFSDERVVPLTCLCGRTLCRDCILAQVKNDKYNCSSCNRSTNIKDLYINRGVSDIVAIIKRIEKQRNLRSKNRQKYQIKPQERDANIGASVNGNQEDENDCVVQVDKEVEAIVKIKSSQIQTTKSYMVSEKFTNREFGANISYKYCFMVPVYFLVQSPWILLPIFSYNQTQPKTTRLIGVWFLNFCIFSILNIINSGTLSSFTYSKLKTKSAILFMLSIFTETLILLYGWFDFLNSISPSNDNNLNFDSTLGLILTGSIFNTFMLVLSIFIILSGHPLIHIPLKLNSQNFSYKKSISMKIFLITFLYLVPDILLIQKEENFSLNKYNYLLNFYLQIISICIFFICSNSRKHMSMCCSIIVLLHLITNISELLGLEGNFMILFIYNGFADVMCLLILIIGKREIFYHTSDKYLGYKRIKV